MLDTRYAIETPEGIDITLRPVGPLPRILAYTVDLLLRWAVLLVLGLFLTYLGAFGIGIISILYFLMEWFYPVFFEVYRGGVTPGKKGFGIRVVHDDGTPVGWSASLIRNLLRAVDLLPFAYIAGLVSMVLDGNFRRLGDLAAGTLVVYQHDAALRLESVAGSAAEKAGARVLPIALDRDGQRALLNFADRHETLSPQRQEELAAILDNLTGEQGKHGVASLLKIANGLKGAQ
ncbi:MAG: RDD family protein [Gammaproteobacteria bacterium]|nr:RDD family protein [Gammaproteobacteria bacterium]